LSGVRSAWWTRTLHQFTSGESIGTALTTASRGQGATFRIAFATRLSTPY
jgi:hypothetical protein